MDNIPHICDVCGARESSGPRTQCSECRASSKRRRSVNRIGPDFREWILRRDDFVCMECGAFEDLVVDHIVPVKFGGHTDPDNLQTLCVACNSSKRDRNNRQGMQQRLQQSFPHMVYYTFMDETGSLIATHLLSHLVHGSEASNGNHFNLDILSFRLGVSADVLMAEANRLVELGIATHLGEPTEEGDVWVGLDPEWNATGMVHRYDIFEEVRT